MQMTDSEIIKSWREAKKPKDQVKVLAELNDVPQKKIVEILYCNGCLSGQAIYQYRKSGMLSADMPETSQNDVKSTIDDTAELYDGNEGADAYGNLMNVDDDEESQDIENVHWTIAEPQVRQPLDELIIEHRKLKEQLAQIDNQLREYLDIIMAEIGNG